MRMLGIAAMALALTIGAAQVPTAAWAQEAVSRQDVVRDGPAPAGTNLRVMVMGEDSDPDTVVRDSDIFKRVLANLKDQGFREGYRLVDEEMLAAELGWKIVTRRDKTDLMEAAQLANGSADARHRSRVMVLFRIHASKTDRDFATRLTVRLAGEIYDLQGRQFLGQFEIPVRSYSAPADCNRLCVSEQVGSHAGELAADLGHVLALKLAHLAPGYGSRSAAMAAMDGPQGPISTYTVTLKNLSAPDAQAIEQVMASEFPGYADHEVFERTPTRVRIDYVSQASLADLNGWLTIVLMDMGIRPGREALVLVEDGNITVDRIVGGAAHYTPRPSRFN